MKELSEKDREGMVDNCRKATFLIEKRQSEKLTLMEKMELEFHLKGCEICTIFMKQSSLINKLVKKVFHSGATNLTLDTEFKDQLQKQIKERMDKK
jgi:hypothetical protein